MPKSPKHSVPISLSQTHAHTYSARVKFDDFSKELKKLICSIFQLDTKDQALDELESRAYIHQTNVSENSQGSGSQKSFETETGNQTSLTPSEREAFEAMKEQVNIVFDKVILEKVPPMFYWVPICCKCYYFQTIHKLKVFESHCAKTMFKRNSYYSFFADYQTDVISGGKR